MSEDRPDRPIGPSGGQEAPATRRRQPIDRILEPDIDTEISPGMRFLGERCEGGMSVILRCRHELTAADRALKILRPELVRDDESRKAFLAEFSRTRDVSGRNVVKVFDIGELEVSVDGRPLLFYSMEWIEGQNLLDLLRENPDGLSTERALDLAGQLADGLANIHKEHLVHLDIKPGNLIVDTNGVLKVLDFGIGIDLRRRQDDLRSGWMTSPYAPWELREGRRELLGPASDVYQIALVVHEMLTGRPVSHLQYKYLSSEIDFLPELIDDLLIRSISHNPEDRPKTAREFRKQLAVVRVRYEQNRKKGRRRPEKTVRELWKKLQVVAGITPRLWEHQAGLAGEILKAVADGGSLPPGAEESEVKRLFDEAHDRLRQDREDRLTALLARGDWGASNAFIETLADHLESEELKGLRRLVAIERDIRGSQNAAQQQAARRQAVELLADVDLPAWQRERVKNLLSGVYELMGAAPQWGGSSEQATVKPAVFDEMAPSLWRLELGDQRRQIEFSLVGGRELRLGRGGWWEFKNHVDLRPTAEEDREDPDLRELCMQISRKSHLQIKVNGQNARAHCGGGYGCAVDGVHVVCGDSRVLGSTGSLTLAERASLWRYKMSRDSGDSVSSITLRGIDGVGRGRIVALITMPILLSTILSDDGVVDHDSDVEVRVSRSGVTVIPRTRGALVSGREIEAGVECAAGSGAEIAISRSVVLRRLS